MSGAPHDLDELKIFLWNRFGELRDTIADPGSLTIQAELPRSAGIDAALDSNLMPLSSSDDLESFVEQTYQERGVCARITIEVPQEEKKSSKYQRGSKKMNIFSQGGTLSFWKKFLCLNNLAECGGTPPLQKVRSWKKFNHKG